jgi:hypothetical protein
MKRPSPPKTSFLSDEELSRDYDAIVSRGTARQATAPMKRMKRRRPSTRPPVSGVSGSPRIDLTFSGLIRQEIPTDEKAELQAPAKHQAERTAQLFPLQRERISYRMGPPPKRADGKAGRLASECNTVRMQMVEDVEKGLLLIGS